MTPIKNINDDKYDMLTHKNAKFLFYQFNKYLTQINEPVKYIKHTEIACKKTNWPFYIERLLEVFNRHLEFENIVGAGNPEEVKIISYSLQKLTPLC